MYGQLSLNAADPQINVQAGIDPLITKLVVGTPYRKTFPSTFMLRNIEVDAWQFSYNVFGYEAWEDIDTERAMRAEITTSDAEFSTLTAKLRRFTHAMKRDEDELKNAHPSLRLRELLAGQARFKVQMNIERIIRNLLTTTTNYPVSHRLAIAGGSEWDAAGGDSRADIREMASAIAGDTGVALEDVSVFLSEKSLNAALSDSTFLGARQNFDTDTPNKDALARYWGVKEILTANPIEYSAAGVVTQMYADVAILFVRNPLGGDWDTEHGEFDFAVNFKWNRGVALEAWYEKKTTTWWFPFQDYANPKIINNKLGAIITNTSSV